VSREAFHLGLIALLAAGCAGTEIELTANSSLKGPVSLTGSVYDENGTLLNVGDGLEEVAHFDETRRFWALFVYIRFNGSEWDVTESVNDALEREGGDAILNLDVEVSGASWMGFAVLIPIIPSYIDITLRGDVARVASNGSRSLPFAGSVDSAQNPYSSRESRSSADGSGSRGSSFSESPSGATRRDP
jgi:hypothetical protein